MRELLYWDLYEISSEHSDLNGVMLRGRLRKLGLENNRNILAENTEDADNGVRFALPHGEDPSLFVDYLSDVIPDSRVSKVAERLANIVLSKLKVNDETRYQL